MRDRSYAFDKLDSLKELLHNEFMQSLLLLGDQIETHEHDAWAAFHLRFNRNRRESTSIVPRRGRKASVMLLKQQLTFPAPGTGMEKKKKDKKVITVDDMLLGSCKQFVDESEEADNTSPSASPLMKKKGSTLTKKKRRVSRVGLAPLDEEGEKTDKVIEDKVKNMVLNMTATATQNTTKAKLTKRLALVKAQKTKQHNDAFVIGAKAHFEFLLFDMCINAKMQDYMDRERAILENKIFTQISTVKRAQSIQHSKDLGQAIKNNCNDQEILALEVNLQKRKDKLHNKLNHRKERKRKEFDEAKAVTMDKLKEKLDDINQESSAAMFSPTAAAKLKGISLMYKMLQGVE